MSSIVLLYPNLKLHTAVWNSPSICLFLTLAYISKHPWEPVVAQGGRILRRLETEQNMVRTHPASLNCPARGACVTLVLS